jgi:hypothetical protein
VLEFILCFTILHADTKHIRPVGADNLRCSRYNSTCFRSIPCIPVYLVRNRSMCSKSSLFMRILSAFRRITAPDGCTTRALSPQPCSMHLLRPTHPITTATRLEVLGSLGKSFYYSSNLLAKASLVFALKPFYLIVLRYRVCLCKVRSL